LSMNIKYKKVAQSPHRTKVARFDVLEKSAINPAIILFFITLTFGGIASFLPLHAVEKGVAGIEMYFIFYAAFLMLSRIFAGKIYDKRGDLYVIPPGVLLVFSAMLLLAWLPNTVTLMVAGSLYGFGFGMIRPALQAWAVDKVEANRKGMVNATFFSFFDLGVVIGAIVFGQIAFLFGYKYIYMVSAASAIVALMYYLYLVLNTNRTLRQQSQKLRIPYKYIYNRIKKQSDRTLSHQSLHLNQRKRKTLHLPSLFGSLRLYQLPMLVMQVESFQNQIHINCLQPLTLLCSVTRQAITSQKRRVIHLAESHINLLFCHIFSLQKYEITLKMLHKK